MSRCCKSTCLWEFWTYTTPGYHKRKSLHAYKRAFLFITVGMSGWWSTWMFEIRLYNVFFLLDFFLTSEVDCRRRITKIHKVCITPMNNCRIAERCPRTQEKIPSFRSHFTSLHFTSLYLSLNRGGRWGTTNDFTTSFLQFLCFLLPSWTWRTPGLSILWCYLPTSKWKTTSGGKLQVCCLATRIFTGSRQTLNLKRPCQRQFTFTLVLLANKRADKCLSVLSKNVTLHGRLKFDESYQCARCRGVAQLAEDGTGTPPTQVRFPGAARDFSSGVNFQCRLSYDVRTPLCATACIYICVHVKDPVIYVRVQWIMEELKHPACTVGWVTRLCRSWLYQGQTTWFSHGRNLIGTIQL